MAGCSSTLTGVRFGSPARSRRPWMSCSTMFSWPKSSWSRWPPKEELVATDILFTRRGQDFRPWLRSRDYLSVDLTTGDVEGLGPNGAIGSQPYQIVTLVGGWAAVQNFSDFELATRFNQVFLEEASGRAGDLISFLLCRPDKMVASLSSFGEGCPTIKRQYYVE